MRLRSSLKQGMYAVSWAATAFAAGAADELTFAATPRHFAPPRLGGAAAPGIVSLTIIFLFRRFSYFFLAMCGAAACVLSALV